MAHLQILQEKFPDTLVIRPVEAGCIIGQGQQSTYNQLSSGRFPVQLVIDHLGRKMVRLLDLANYLDGLQIMPALDKPKKRGRPTKREQFERATRQSRTEVGI